MPIKKTIALLTLLMTASHLHSQINPDILRSYGGPYVDHGNDISLNTDGYIFVAGGTDGNMSLDSINFNYNPRSAFVSCFDSLGNTLWARNFADMSLHAVASDDKGNAYVAGSLRDTVNIDGIIIYPASPESALILSFNPNGQLRWSHVDTVSNMPGDGVYWDICLSEYGQVFATGMLTNGSVSAFDASTGTPLWSKGFSSLLRCEGTGIEYALQSLYVTGFYTDYVYIDTIKLTKSFNGRNPFLAKLDSTGQVVWAVSDTNYESIQGNKLAILPGDSVVIGGKTYQHNIFLSLYDGQGNNHWYRTWGNSAESDALYGVEADDKNIYFSGNTGGDSIAFLYNMDFCIGKTSFSGKEEWFYSNGGSQDLPLIPEFCGNIEVRDENLYLTGAFKGSFSMGNFSLQSQGSLDLFVGRLQQDNYFELLGWPRPLKTVDIFPNPASDRIHIRTNSSTEAPWVEISDKAGRILHRAQLHPSGIIELGDRYHYTGWLLISLYDQGILLGSSWILRK